MIYLSVEGLSKSYPDQVLFENLKFGLNKGDKVGLIANNGAGKTSLLNVLVGKDTPDSGKVYLRDNLSVGYLEQEPDLDNNLTITEMIEGSHTEMLQVIRAYEKALAAQSENYSTQTQQAFDKASDQMDQLKAWDYERRLKQLLDKFLITQLDQPIGTLSGGEKKRLAMAMTLLDDPDLLVVDEPTNHLDVGMIQWLEKYLAKSNITLLMVTHDRYFLDRICNHILELHDGKMYHHKGNYAYFLEKRIEREAVFKTEVDKAGKLMLKELDWMRRSPKARTTKAKARINSFYKTKDKASTKLTKDELQLDVKMARVGGKILELKKVYKSYGDIHILKGFSHTFSKGERIGIIGDNGTGKTTFLNILMGAETADSGKVNVGDNTVFGYYTQKGLVLKEDKRIIDILKDISEVITLGDGAKLTASEFLKHFLFPPKMQRTFYSKLSGGEKRRLYLLTVLIRNPNFLIMDEPTNDLDLLTLTKLEDFLENFKGCLILVSHDRYFMDKLVDQLLIFEGDGVTKGFVGTYMEYRDVTEALKKKERALQAKEKSSKAAASPSPPKEKTKLTFKEKYEYEALGPEIEALEAEKAALEKSLNEEEHDYDSLQEKSARLGVVIDLIEEKVERWVELGEWV